MFEVTPWWIAISSPGAERKATAGLDEAGFECWWPIRLVQRRPRHAKHKIIETELPAFPGYLFARHGDQDAWPRMRDVDGLRAVLCINHVAAQVSDAELQRVRKQIAYLAFSQATVTLPEIAPGTEVRITEGPMAGVRGLLTRLLGSGAVEVNVEVFGGAARARVRRDMVEVG